MSAAEKTKAAASTTQPPKEKKPLWVTRAMAEEFTRQEVLFTTFKEAILYFIFVVAVIVSTIGRRTSGTFYITQALKSQFLELEFKTANEVGITYGGIRTATDFWHYAQSLLMDSFYWEHYYNPYDPVAKTASDDKKILYENKLLGVPRMRQVKVTNDSCIIHEYFRRLFLTCFDLYNEVDEDTEPFGLKKGKAWVYNSDKQTKSISYTGKISEYGGGGYYQDLKPDRESSIKIIEKLEEHFWITKGTRAIFIDFSVYNANLNLFCICKLVFEFPPTGGVIPSHSFKAMQIINYLNKWDYLFFTFEVIVYILCVYYILEELREILYFKFRYFLQFWTYIDWMIISLVIGQAVTSYAVLPSIGDAIDQIKKNPNKYGNLENIAYVMSLHNSFSANLLFFSHVKCFKYLSFNKTMGQLNNTLRNCAWDIMGFTVMFLIIFFAFTELGYLLFGSQVEDFSSFGVAMFTLLRTILGDFDYQSIEQANRVLAPLYFLSYIFFVFFVLLNMFLAIINDTYADVKTEIAIAPDEMQMTEFLKTGLFNLLKKFGCEVKQHQSKKSEFMATIEQIRDALKKCGFSDYEIERFFARYNINPAATEESGYDVNVIMKALEGSGGEKDKAEASSVVQLSDFVAQQGRLDQIERTIRILGSRVDALLQKLETMDNARKP